MLPAAAHIRTAQPNVISTYAGQRPGAAYAAAAPHECLPSAISDGRADTEARGRPLVVWPDGSATEASAGGS